MDLGLDLTLGAPVLGISAAPALANQSISLGRESLASGILLTESNGGLANTGGPIDSVTLGTPSVGTGAHFAAEAPGIGNAAVPSDPVYTFTGCTATGPGGTSAPFDLTINTVANERTAHDLTSLEAIFALAAATVSGDTIKLMGGNYASFTISGKAYTSEVVVTAQSITNKPILDRVITNTSENLRFTGMIWRNTTITNNVNGIFEFQTGSDNIRVDLNEITGPAFVPGQTPAMAKAFESASSNLGTITIQDNFIHEIYQGFRVVDIQGSLTFEGNYVHRHYFDGFFIRRTTSAGTITRFAQNTFDTCLNEGEGHADVIQLSGADLTEDWEGVQIVENIYRYDLLPLVQLNFCECGATFVYKDPQVHRNVGMSNTAHATTFNHVDGGLITNNTFVHPSTALGAGTQPHIFAGLLGVRNPAEVYGNVVEGIFADSGDIIEAGNILLGLRGATNGYDTVLIGPWDTVPADRAALLAAAAMRLNGPADQVNPGTLDVGDAGAVGSGAWTPPTTTPGTAGSARNTAYETFHRSGAWVEVYTATLDNNETGFFQFTGVQIIPISNLTQSGGTQIRITLTPADSGNNTKINSIYVSNGGGTDIYDHGEPPTQLFVGASAAFTLTAGGASVVTDAAAFVKDGINDLIIAFDLDNSSANDWRRGTVANNAFYGKFNVSEAGLEDKPASGAAYTDLTASGSARLIASVELFI